jgi:opacity protein-like surface antigen
MTSIKRLVIPLLAGVAASHAVNAQESAPTASAKERFEVTPSVGYRAGQNFAIDGSDQNGNIQDHGSYAIAISHRIEDFRFELFYSRQPTRIDSSAASDSRDLDIEYLHFGASTISDSRRLKPYLLGAIGITRFSLDTEGVDDDATRFSLSIATGLEMPLRERLDLRLEGRGYLTSFTSDSSIFCGSKAAGGGCALQRSGSAFLQFEVLVGVAFSF